VRSRTAKQKAASRRNLAVARSKRRRVAVAAGVGTAVVLGSAVAGRKAYNNQFETYYHGTTHHAARQIVKNGYNGTASRGASNYRHGSSRKTPHSRYMYMTPKPSDYGHYQVKIKVRKKYAAKHIRADYNDWPQVQYKINRHKLGRAVAGKKVKMSHHVPRKHRTRQAVRTLNTYGRYKI
jgi:hypothetical protein